MKLLIIFSFIFISACAQTPPTLSDTANCYHAASQPQHNNKDNGSTTYNKCIKARQKPTSFNDIVENIIVEAIKIAVEDI